MASLQTNCTLNNEQAIGPQLHSILRERIIRNDLKPGTKISEPEMARVYNISRQPVREVFIKLSEEGLIAIRPQRSTIVCKINYIAVLDARFVREAIEADIVKLVAKNSNKTLIKELRHQLVLQTEAIEKEPFTFIQLDEKFHRTLAKAAEKINAWKLIEGLKSQMDRVRILRLGQFPVETLVDQHNDIVDMIEQCNIEGSEQALRTHLREILNILPQILENNPDLFDGHLHEDMGIRPNG